MAVESLDLAARRYFFLGTAGRRVPGLAGGASGFSGGPVVSAGASFGLSGGGGVGLVGGGPIGLSGIAVLPSFDRYADCPPCGRDLSDRNALFDPSVDSGPELAIVSRSPGREVTCSPAARS
ncbi:MAG: hypothetical protein DMF80_01540 [Acidobacteria bacterium]|nr:MAG: hypothetical protein DMF80_01540 [Acidobacteriota bacterium]PYQ18277.1 MAG: hypothetical protein DMF81_25375 [Acidobacteriota bacterium]